MFEEEEEEYNTDNLRVIQTARNEKDINDAVKKGFRPLVKKVIPSNEIRSKYAVFQNKNTGEIVVSGDYRSDYSYWDEYETVIDWSFYYPNQFESPYAAYLIPKDIEIGEKVFLEDIIEDIVAGSWNQGNAWRLEYSEAIWNGEDFEVLKNVDTPRRIIG